uniref:Transglutaminase N-terminal domain-containing protein n=1 Tax=Poecilia latipinna TaxID=48699 RepID=A0A3B3TVH5_9TELE
MWLKRNAWMSFSETLNVLHVIEGRLCNCLYHHTSEISVKELIVRRGQAFKLTLKLTQPFNLGFDHLASASRAGHCIQLQPRRCGRQSFNGALLLKPESWF